MAPSNLSGVTNVNASATLPWFQTRLTTNTVSYIKWILKHFVSMALISLYFYAHELLLDK